MYIYMYNIIYIYIYNYIIIYIYIMYRTSAPPGAALLSDPARLSGSGRAAGRMLHYCYCACVRELFVIHVRVCVCCCFVC